MLTIDDAVALTQALPTEIAHLGEDEVGPLITMTSGATYVVVPADQPDAEGKTGVMLRWAPNPKSSYICGVYAPPVTDDPEVEAEAEKQHQARVALPEDGSMPPPSASAAVMLAWVGEDVDRAREALDAETARSRPRTGLISKLEALLEVADVEGGGVDGLAELEHVTDGTECWCGPEVVHVEGDDLSALPGPPEGVLPPGERVAEGVEVGEGIEVAEGEEAELSADDETEEVDADG